MPQRAVIVLLALTAGCGVTDFDIDQPIIEQHITGSVLPGPLAVLFPLPLDLDLSAKIKEQETGPIDSVTLSSLTLSITATDRPSGDTDDWSFVEEIHVFVKSRQSGTTLPRVEIAHVASPGVVTEMKFICDQHIDLDPYVNEGSVIETMGKGTIPPDDVSYDGKSVFTVHPL